MKSKPVVESEDELSLTPEIRRPREAAVAARRAISKAVALTSEKPPAKRSRSKGMSFLYHPLLNCFTYNVI